MKKILLPTDFSKDARCAAEYAIEMFKSDNVEFYLVHTYVIPYTAETVLVFADEMLQKESKRSLAKERTHLLNKFKLPSTDIKTKLEYGELSSALIELTKKLKIDLIVMGTKGATGLKKILLGSNTTDVLNRVDVPLLIVPKNTKYTPLKIALAVDFEKVSYEKIVSPLKDILQQDNLDLAVVNVNINIDSSNKEEVTEVMKLKKTFKGLPIQFHYLREEEVMKGLNQFILNNSINMLVMISHQYTLIKRLFHNSVTNSMSMATNIPLLILKEKVSR